MYCAETERSRFIFCTLQEKVAVRLSFTTAQCSADEENDPQENMDDVIHFSEHQQTADIKHMVGPSAREPSRNAQQQIDYAEDKTERSSGTRCAGEPKI